ncbi:MAG TPA: substrate-binding domain-containing protein [Burkholderiales bacterium]|nr:substrate-binding domain-containing protein [Burkholderiales bacterium]
MHTKIEISLDSAWLSAPGLPRERGRALVLLLRELEQSSSLREAARGAGMSYRFAWGLLGDAGRILGTRLVEMQRGRGARLSEPGRNVLRADARVREVLSERFEQLRSEVPQLLAGTRPTARPRLALHASHDLAIALLPDLCASTLDLEVSFRGSDDCLAALARNECDLAGFHVADALPRAAAAAAALGKWLDSRKHAVLHFVRREQGLIVRPGSRIRNVHDLARPGVRFIHRQNSGSAGTGRDAPVAVAVARGHADAGFGLRAEAAEHKLSFVPLAVERYFIACPKSLQRSASLLALLEILRSAAFRAQVERLPGYDASEAGKRHALDAALTWVEAAR